MPAAAAVVFGAAASAAGTLGAGHVSADTTCTSALVASPTVFDTGQHCFVIPANVTSIHAVLIGGSGGAGATGKGTQLEGAGGLGGHGMQVSGDIPVTAGEVLWVYVGGNGQAGATNGTGGAGGFNGGAQAGGDGRALNYAGGGGGATDLRTGQATTPFTDCRGVEFSGQNQAAGAAGSFVLVAGGGGGGGNGSDGPPPPPGSTTTAVVSIAPDGGNGGSQPGDSSPPSAGTAGKPAGGGGGGEPVLLPRAATAGPVLAVERTVSTDRRTGRQPSPNVAAPVAIPVGQTRSRRAEAAEAVTTAAGVVGGAVTA